MQKPNKRYNKILKLSLALLLCMSLFIFPVAVHAGENGSTGAVVPVQAVSNPHVAPPTVDAEIIGSLLRIRTTSGFFAVEAVYINGRRFNHRVDSALVVDISQYIATGNTIAIHAVDFAGNSSDTVLLTPPPPAQPPQPNNITPDGQGEVLDRLTDEDGIEFLTITTPAGNVFHLIIDHTRANNNVYFLNAVTEWDLLTLAAEAELPTPPQISPPQPPPQEPIVREREPQEYEPTPTPPTVEPTPAEDSGGGMGRFIFLAVGGAAAFGVIYYLKILKPKQEREMYADDNGGQDGEDGFEDIDENEGEDNQ